MPFTYTRIGDLYLPVWGTFIFHEIIDYKEQLCFRTFAQLAPFWTIDTYRTEDFKYIGNGVDDPALRRRCECLSEINFWLMYGPLTAIPKTPDYYAAMKQWEKQAPTAQEVLIRKAYQKQKRWLSSQLQKDWGVSTGGTF